jgi:hypothetical protein
MQNDLQAAGYTYEYLSPDNLANLSNAYVANGTPAPEVQAFKALVLRANESLTVEGVSKLTEFAHAGLPILFAGGVPTYFISYNTTSAQSANSTMTSLLALINVHIVPSTNLASSLEFLGIYPRAHVSANAT